MNPKFGHIIVVVRVPQLIQYVPLLYLLTAYILNIPFVLGIDVNHIKTAIKVCVPFCSEDILILTGFMINGFRESERNEKLNKLTAKSDLCDGQIWIGTHMKTENRIFYLLTDIDIKTKYITAQLSQVFVNGANY